MKRMSDVGRRTPAVWRMVARVTVVTALAFGLALTATPAVAQGLQLQQLGGGSMSESQMLQGTTIAVFFASWSPRGKDVVERINQINAKWGNKARVVAINFQEDQATVQQFLSGQKLNVPVLLDESGRFSKKYAVTWLPGLLVLQDGETAFRGRLGDNPDSVLSQSLG